MTNEELSQKKIDKEALLQEVARQTKEIDYHREQVTVLGRERRELFSDLRALGVTYKQLAAATGLHQVTIQQNMGRFRNEMSHNEESCTVSPNSEAVVAATSV
jgi:transcription initiation factor TFIID subunit TAF12